MVSARAVAAIAGLLAILVPTAHAADSPPKTNLMILSGPDVSGMVTIDGAPGAVEPGSDLIAVSTSTGRYGRTSSSADGSFHIALLSHAGDDIMIKSDVRREVVSNMLAVNDEGQFPGLPGTIVHVPERAGEGVPFSISGLTLPQPGRTLPSWSFQGSLEKSVFAAGEPIRVTGKLVIDSAALESTTAAITAEISLSLDRIAGAAGEPALMQNFFASSFATPTGLLIDRGPPFQRAMQRVELTMTRISARRVEVDADLSLVQPAGTLSGWYRPFVSLVFSDLPGELASSTVSRIEGAVRAPFNRRNTVISGRLPLIRIGDPAPPRMLWTLLTSTLAAGVHGASAVEDRGSGGVTPHIVVQPDVPVIPRDDPRSGARLRYRLEPFLPFVSVGDRGWTPSTPSIPFRFPSGSLTVRIERPDGTVSAIGPAPFVQSRIFTPVSSPRRLFDSGGGALSDVYQLSTMRDELEVTFDQYGRHRITMEGSIDDVWGNRWEGRGTWEILVAQPLVLDFSLIPGTPLEAGDFISPSMQVFPPVPADIEVTVRLAPDSKKESMETSTLRARANRFGRATLEPLQMQRTGEYRVDATATWRDPANGSLFAATRTWGSVVAPRQSSLRAHGRRGADDNQGDALRWFHRSDLQTSGAGSHIHLPYEPGDVAWMKNDDAMATAVTVNDLTGALEPLLRRCCSPPTSGFFDGDRIDAGESPLFSGRPDGLDPNLDPSRVDLWGYAYRFIERPLVAVREIVGEDQVWGNYWRFDAHYGAQQGVGINGDLPNDFKFQFGGAVVRGTAVGAPRYGIYGSLFVLLPDGDSRGSRVFPPFRGGESGADGGPLFTLKGKAIDLFFHPTAVRSGTILHRGQNVSFAGYSAPPLSSKVEIVVTSPSGVSRTIAGQASSIGWFHDPARDFAPSEPGLWKAKVKIVFDGRTSAGQLTAPFPAGDVLGSREGELFFFVVDASTPQLELAPMPRFVRPADGPIVFTAIPPSGLTNVQLTYTINMPGFILAEKTQTSMSVSYDASALANDFPNLDLHDAEGHAGADTIVISLLLSGTEATGLRRHFARQVVIQGEEIQMPEQHPRTKRRAVRP